MIAEKASATTDICFYISSGSDPLVATWTLYIVPQTVAVDRFRISQYSAFYQFAGIDIVGGVTSTAILERSMMLLGMPAFTPFALGGPFFMGPRSFAVPIHQRGPPTGLTYGACASCTAVTVPTPTGTAVITCTSFTIATGACGVTPGSITYTSPLGPFALTDVSCAAEDSCIPNGQGLPDYEMDRGYFAHRPFLAIDPGHGGELLITAHTFDADGVAANSKVHVSAACVDATCPGGGASSLWGVIDLGPGTYAFNPAVAFDDVRGTIVTQVHVSSSGSAPELWMTYQLASDSVVSGVFTPRNLAPRVSFTPTIGPPPADGHLGPWSDLVFNPAFPLPRAFAGASSLLNDGTMQLIAVGHYRILGDVATRVWTAVDFSNPNIGCSSSQRCIQVIDLS